MTDNRIEHKNLVDGVQAMIDFSTPMMRANGTLAKAIVDALYSQEPQQVVCLECGGFGKITIAGCSRTTIERCPLCGGAEKRISETPQVVCPKPCCPEPTCNNRPVVQCEACGMVCPTTPAKYKSIGIKDMIPENREFSSTPAKSQTETPYV